MPSSNVPVKALMSVAIALGGCNAKYRDVTSDLPYKPHIGKICEVIVPLRAHGYAFTIERDKKTDAISIWNPGFSGPEVTFVLTLSPGTKFTLVEARECVNCPFDPNPEYRVRVSPEPKQFEGKPAYLRAFAFNEMNLRCTSGANAV